ncbi:hypothetical protein Q3G72_024810 [Acer saccharum]|nr:hypothetical protein Q3G72_024810 [Acer saccharum]
MPKMGSFLLLFFFFFIFPVFVQSQNTRFIFEGFNGAANNLTLELEASIMINPGGVLRLTDKSNKVIGRAFYNKPIQMIDKTSCPNASSFSTSFVFEIVPPSSSSGGYGLAFLLAPSRQLPGAEPDDILPFVDDWGSADYSQQGSEFGSRTFQISDGADYSQQGSEFGSRTFQISDGTFKTSHRSHHSYSSTEFSSSSIYSCR